MNGTLSALAGCEAVRLSQVEEQTTALAVITDDLAKMVDTIERHLGSVMRGSEPTPELPNIKVPEELLVPLAGNLPESWRKVNAAVNRLRVIDSAIELPSS